MSGIKLGRMQSSVFVLSLVLLLSACSYTTQTTSGRAYLENYPSTLPGGHGQDVNEQVSASANVEPILRFPARIGLAKVDASGLRPIPQAEAEAWQQLIAELGPAYGSFVMVSPLVVELSYVPYRIDGEHVHYLPAALSEVIRKVRLGAARQHLDAVLVY